MKNEIVKRAANFIAKNSPHILTGLGCAGLVSTAILTAKATAQVYKEDNFNMQVTEHQLEKAIFNNDEELEEELTNKLYTMHKPSRMLKLYWKYYIPPIMMGATSIACIIGANTVSTRRQAALATLYSISEVTLNDYREKVTEMIGKSKAQKIEDEVVQKRLDDNPVSKNEVIITGKGETLCFDTFSGRYFNSDIETIRRIQNDLNHDLMGAMWVPINDFYYTLGLGPVKMGEEIGWTTDELIDITFTSKIADDGRPCLVIDLNADVRGSGL